MIIKYENGNVSITLVEEAGEFVRTHTYPVRGTTITLPEKTIADIMAACIKSFNRYYRQEKIDESH